MNPHAGCTTQNQRNRVYPYAGHGLTTRGTVEVAPIWWVFVSAAGALMPFMVAACPNKHTRGFRAGPLFDTDRAIRHLWPHGGSTR